MCFSTAAVGQLQKFMLLTGEWPVVIDRQASDPSRS
jgi:hypothetical protein